MPLSPGEGSFPAIPPASSPTRAVCLRRDHFAGLRFGLPLLSFLGLLPFICVFMVCILMNGRKFTHPYHALNFPVVK